MRRMRIYSGIAVCLSVMMLATSCMVGKKYRSPELNMPEYVVSDEVDSLLLADMNWWEIYSDTCLVNLIGDALENNKDMVVAAGRIRELEASKRVSNAALYPSVGANAYGKSEWENYRGENPTMKPEYGAKLSLNWELDLWGNLRWAKRQSVSEYLNSIEARRGLQMTIVAEVAQAYFELIALDNELSIVKQTLVTREESVHQAKLRFEGGLTSETAYQQAQVELATTATYIPELMRRIAVKESELALLCGRYPGEVERRNIDSEMVVPGDVPAGLRSELLLRRPDVRAAEQSLIAAHASMNVAYTDRFPRIRLTGTYGLEGDQLSSFIRSPYSFALGDIAAPIFAFNSKKSKYRAKQAAYEQEIARYEKTVLTVFKEVNDAIIGYDSARQARELQEDLESAANKYIELAQLQYINGVINYLDVLDAQRKHFDAQRGLSNAVRDEYVAFVRLYKALGGGWEES